MAKALEETPGPQGIVNMLKPFPVEKNILIKRIHEIQEWQTEPSVGVSEVFGTSPK